MTLRARLLLGTSILSLAIIVGLSWMVRSSWETLERERFEHEFQTATADFRGDLSLRAQSLKQRLIPFCLHDTAVDSALVGLESGTLSERVLAVKLSMGEHQRALELDELALVTSSSGIVSGTVRGSGALVGDQDWLQELVQHDGARLRTEPSLALEAACRKESGRHAVILFAAKEVSSLLAEAAQRHGLDLNVVQATPSLDPPAPARLSQTLHLSELGEVRIAAHRSRQPLSDALSKVDGTVATSSAAILVVAFLVAALLARGLSQPVIAFAERTRRAVSGHVEPLPVEGGPELEAAARAFNQTLSDLEKLRDRLQVTERIAARRELARQIAHELKNPLMPIRTSMETLLKLKRRGDPRFDVLFEEASQTVLSEVQRLTQMVESFSRYARLPSPRPAPCDLADVAQGVARLHQELGARVEFRIEGNAGGTVMVFADRDQITQAVTNLVKNGIEATQGQPDASVLLTVRLHQPGGGEGAQGLLEVCDNGPGVPPELEARLFDPYVTSKRAGTGLGLAISHRIAVEHGGDLTYQSRDGACFLMALPVAGPPSRAQL